MPRIIRVARCVPEMLKPSERESPRKAMLLRVDKLINRPGAGTAVSATRPLRKLSTRALASGKNSRSAPAIATSARMSAARVRYVAGSALVNALRPGRTRR